MTDRHPFSSELNFAALAHELLEDSSPGIPEDIRAKIFEPFSTMKPTSAETDLGFRMTSSQFLTP